MSFRFRIPRKPYGRINLPGYPRQSTTADAEDLTGMVDGMTASAPEERMAKALKKHNIQFVFRQSVGAPRGLPGWKELDFMVNSGGMLYAVEVDTAFTHRMKAQSDVLHDAIILNDKELSSAGQLYPKVFHADGDTELSTQTNADEYVKKTFPRASAPLQQIVQPPSINVNAPATIPQVEIPQSSIETEVKKEKKKEDNRHEEKLKDKAQKQKHQQKEQEKKQQKQQKKQEQKKQEEKQQQQKQQKEQQKKQEKQQQKQEEKQKEKKKK